MELGFCSSEDKEQVRALYEHAFDDSQAFVDYYFDQKYRPEHVMIINDDDRVVSMVHLNPYVVNYNDREYSISYFVAVATQKEYRNKGYMGKIIKQSLNHLYQKGEVFSLLMPIDNRIYERYGFGFVEDHMSIDCISKAFMLSLIEFTYQEVNSDTCNQLVAIYAIFAKRFNLSTIRDQEYFARLYDELRTDEGRILLFAEGYIITYYLEDVLHVREFVSNSEHSFREMISYLIKETDGGRLIINDHVKSEIRYFLPHVTDVNLVPFMMARIINVEAFIKMNLNMFCKNVKIKVQDAFILDNNKIYEIQDGIVRVYNKGEFDIVLNIKTLTQLVFGYIDDEDIHYFEPGVDRLYTKMILCDQINGNNFFNEYV